MSQLEQYLKDRHVFASSDWIKQQQQQGGNFETIYHRWLEQDWNNENFRKQSKSSLPSDLNLSLLNIEKLVFNGKYLLQINNIIDISKPLPTGEEIADNDDADCGNDNDDNEEENFSNLFKKSKNQPKNSKSAFFRNGPRMLELCLSDGHKECVAIEYKSIPYLHEKLIGAKILLCGPFDVYVGSILLRAQNVKLISEVTFEQQTTSTFDLQTNSDETTRSPNESTRVPSDTTRNPNDTTRNSNDTRNSSDTTRSTNTTTKTILHKQSTTNGSQMERTNSTELLDLFADIDNFEPMDF